MAFNGIIPAAPLEVRPCGLFSVARLVDHREEDEHWISGAEIETIAYPTVEIRNNQDAVVANGEGVIFDGSDKGETYKTTPFHVELKTSKTSLKFIQGGGLTDDLEKQAKAVAQKAIEFELWEGVATRSSTPTSEAGFLRRPADDGGATVVTSGGVSPEKALWLLEQSISESPTGGPGIIHMTADVASALGSRIRYFEKNEIDQNTYAITRIGTLVVIGAGYTGAGPLGGAGEAASATNKWMYATGSVTVETGKYFVQEYSTPATNDHYATISLPAAVHFDPSIFSAAQVTLS
ncbi:hypothetical protein SEA_CECE_72 [Microbacterium phage Cece]|nr:hypothetical protein SEA_CECE_72 [Microbacterium phage Cece]